MAHEHKVEKIKKGSSFDCDGPYFVLQNVSQRTLFAGGANLFPDDTAWYCGADSRVDKLIKDNKLKIVETHSAKQKPKKQKEEKSEESSPTVAEPSGEASVQLSSSEDDVAPLTEQ